MTSAKLYTNVTMTIIFIILKEFSWLPLRNVFTLVRVIVKIGILFCVHKIVTICQNFSLILCSAVIVRFLSEHWIPLISVANGRNRDLASAAVLPPTTRAARRATTGGRTEDDATSIQRPPPSLPPSTASRRVSSSSASSSISSAVAISPSNGEQADSGRDYMATDGEQSALKSLFLAHR